MNDTCSIVLLLVRVACLIIRDFPDHATFREKGAKLACADKLEFSSLRPYVKR